MASQRAFRIAAVLTLLVTLAILFASPNFQRVEGRRSSPFGGDALNEWIGSRIARFEPHRLYDQDYAYALQHDPEVIGYQSDESNYFPMVYPPFYYVLLRPLSYVDSQNAAIVQFALMSICVVASLWIVSRVPLTSEAQRQLAPVLCAAALFMPLVKSLSMAQKSSVLLLLFVASYELFRRKRFMYSGVAAGLLAFKPQMLIVAIIVMAFQRQWRWLVGCFGCMAVLAAICLLTGFSTCLDYVDFARNAGDYMANDGYLLAESHSLQGFFALLSRSSNSALVKACVGTAAVVVLYWAIRIATEPRATYESSSESRPDFIFAAICLATPLTSPHFYTYDLAILLLPMFLLWRQSFSSPQYRSLRKFALLVYFAGIITVPTAELTGVQISVVVSLCTLGWMYRLTASTVVQQDRFAHVPWMASKSRSLP